MANSPSQKWEDGKLVTRAQDARGESEENTAEAVTGTPTKPHGYPNSTFSQRRAAREGTNRKAVDGDQAEDKSVGSSERKSATKGRR